MDDSTSQLKQYVQQHLDKGISAEEIRSHLVNHGWSRQDVDLALSSRVSNTRPPSSSSRPSTSLFKSKKFVVGLVTMLVVLAALLVVLLLLHSSKSTAPTISRDAPSVTRRNDAGLVAYAVSQYAIDHKNTLPGVVSIDTSSGAVTICGSSSCAAKDKVSVTLSHYKSASSSIQFKSYSADLKVPDADTLYIVNGATCKADRSGLGAQGSNSGIATSAILYSLPAGTGATQQCLST